MLASFVPLTRDWNTTPSAHGGVPILSSVVHAQKITYTLGNQTSENSADHDLIPPETLEVRLPCLLISDSITTNYAKCPLQYHRQNTAIMTLTLRRIPFPKSASQVSCSCCRLPLPGDNRSNDTVKAKTGKSTLVDICN